MCGIIGLLSNNRGDYLRKRKWFEGMLYSNALRGMDSTGIFGVPHQNSLNYGGKHRSSIAIDANPFIVKRAFEASDFLKLRPVTDRLTNAEKYAALIGHNRAATVGKLTHQNAHPFQIGDITLVHNGTLQEYASALPDYTDFEVDSESIAHSINKIGIEKTAEMMSGAFALVWHDARNNTINLLRNEERPLYFATTTEKVSGKELGGDILIASESNLIRWISSRQGSYYDIKQVLFPKPGDMIVFHLEDINNYEVKTLNLRKTTTTTTTTTSTTTYHNGKNSGSSTKNVNYQLSINRVCKKVGCSGSGDIMTIFPSQWEAYSTSVSPVETPNTKGYLTARVTQNEGTEMTVIRVHDVTKEESASFIGKQTEVVITSATEGVSSYVGSKGEDMIHAKRPVLVSDKPQEDLVKKNNQLIQVH